MSLFSIIGTLRLLAWVFCGVWALRLLDSKVELQRSRALPFVNAAALIAGPVVLAGLLFLRFLRRPLQNFARRLLLDDGIPMVFARNGEAISDATLAGAASRPVRRSFKKALEQAVALRATDLLSEPLPDGGAALRLRVGGLLRTRQKLSAAEAKEVLRLIGVLAGSDPELDPRSERIVEFRCRGRSTSLRIGMLKVSGGIRISLHLLQPEQPLETPADLGLDPQQTDAIRDFLALRNGMIVIAGESGSGRSLALERLLDLADLTSRSAILVSSSAPVRLRPEVMRIGEGEESLRDAALAAVQQSPDLLAVDEVNDRGLFSSLLGAARSDRLVIAVFRSAGLDQTMARLLALGAGDAGLADTLRLVIQVHPLRRLCRCAQPTQPTQEESDFLHAAGLSEDRLRAASGCADCDSGYRGRTAAFELYTPGEAMRETLRAPQPPPISALRTALEREIGTASAYTAGCRTAALGLTSLAEAALLRQPVTQEEFRG